MTTRSLFVMGCAVTLGTAMLRPAAVGAQRETTALVGSVRDSSGHGVPGAEVRIGASDVFTRTGEGGGFRLGAVPVGAVTLGVRRLGFAPGTATVTLRAGRVDSLVISLVSVAATLPGVLVEDEATTRSKRLLAGFWDRRSHGFGNFLTRDDIVHRDASQFVDLVRMVPSAAIVSVNGRQTIRFKRGIGQRDCPPQYFVDGMRLEQATPDEFAPEDMEAIEIYAGPATIPPQFAARPFTYTCGAIVIWTRLPGP